MGYMEVIKEYQDALVKDYPGLKVRWVRIFGKRWAHLYGDSTELSAGSPLKIEIKPNFGLCIDNSEIIPTETLEEIIASIKERFIHVDLV